MSTRCDDVRQQFCMQRCMQHISTRQLQASCGMLAGCQQSNQSRTLCCMAAVLSRVSSKPDHA